MKFKDYYETLGVARTAKTDEIRHAYRKLARKYHPDVSREKNAEERFKEVQEAYEVLKDAEKRASYDQLGRNYRAGQQFRPPPGWEGRFGGGGGAREFSDLHGFSDFFSTMFGAAAAGGAGRGRPRSEPEAEAGQLEVSLEDVFTGTRRRIGLQEHGRERTVEVQIPAGVADGQALRIAGEGGRPAVLVRIKYLSHPLYSVQGRDVSIELPLAPWEAALGAKIEVPTLGGKVDLRIPAGAQSGQKLRLRGRGLPGKSPGDQLVVIRIVTPAAESAAARAAYERMRSDFDFDARAGWPQG
ncbi:MAG: DnaJ C-terminal domain-containing protein [Steroidobacterales bacterium]